MHQPQRIGAVARDADHDHPELGVEEVPQVLADRRMVVGDDDPERAGGCGHRRSIAVKLIGLNRFSDTLTRPRGLSGGSVRQ